MILKEAIALVESTLQRMSALYGGALFDEWAIVRPGGMPATIVHYHGNRSEEFRRNFNRDVAPLRQESVDRAHEVGAFEFARTATGTQFDAALMLGTDSYLLCNNTTLSMADIRLDPRWIKAQVPFVELSEKVRANPLVFL
jgi:hypothetical protein